MSNSVELVRAWVIETLWPLADDDDHQARLRDTLRVFLEENGGDSLASPRRHLLGSGRPLQEAAA